VKHYHQTPDGEIHELNICQWLFLSTDMMMLPERYEGHRLIDIFPDEDEEDKPEEETDDGIL
jgi:hypothetical protein